MCTVAGLAPGALRAHNDPRSIPTPKAGDVKEQIKNRKTSQEGDHEQGKQCFSAFLDEEVVFSVCTGPCPA